METPLKISFRNMDPSPAVEAHIRERVQKLERLFDHVVSCGVSVQSTARQHRKGKLYHLHIELGVPGRQIVVKRETPEHQAHQDILVALRDAFDAAERQLQDYVRSLRGQTKHHETPAHGRIARLFREDGYGFIRSSTGDEIYLHRNALLGGSFDTLREGDEVRYVVHDGEGEKGLQASSVTRIGKHHPVP